MTNSVEQNPKTDFVRLLAKPQTTGVACGKVILVGEHSAVDGFPAIALPLKSQTLVVRFGEPLLAQNIEAIQTNSNNVVSRWHQCWSLSINNQAVEIGEQERARLTQSLALALDLLHDFSNNGEKTAASRLSLSDYPPQQIYIESKLPLGAGMGGSAALSAALIRALVEAFQLNFSNDDISRLANELDGVFHGRASGLDAATVVSDSIIRFQKGKGAAPISNRLGFWLLLIDTGERTATREMVRRVAALREREPESVASHFGELAKLTGACELALANGDLVQLGSTLNQAHTHLQAIDVSTKGLDACVEHLRRLGALGAKLTGGGGGGLALGVFANRPDLHLDNEWSHAPHFLTFVTADKSS
ncbi:MAG: hypothetical protein RI953_110 [Pseudomonadota bacterium]